MQQSKGNETNKMQIKKQQKHTLGLCVCMCVRVCVCLCVYACVCVFVCKMILVKYEIKLELAQLLQTYRKCSLKPLCTRSIRKTSDEDKKNI